MVPNVPWMVPNVVFRCGSGSGSESI
jgi:hypothetical protein